jgi:hypothetical protein
MQLALERMAEELGITLGGEVIVRVMRELFPQRAKTMTTDLLEEDTVPYDLDVSIEDVLAGMATPTPVWTARPC